jgi:hypothetical protein
VNPRFNEILESNLNAIPSTLPLSGNTICSWILSLYEEQKMSLAEKLSKACSLIYTFFDLWSRSNMREYFELVGH